MTPAFFREEMALVDPIPENAEIGRSGLDRDHLTATEPADRARSEVANAEIVQVLERVSDAFVALDANWRYTYVNEKAARIFGRSRDDLIGKHIWTELPEDTGQPLHRACEQAMREQVSVHLEDYYAPNDRWLETRIYPSRDGLSIFFNDITDRKKADLSLKASEERLRLAIEGADLGTWHWNLETGEVHFSERGLILMGMPPGTPMSYGSSLAAVHPDDRTWVDAAARRASSEGPKLELEFRTVWPDGSIHWVAVRGLTTYDQAGRALHMEGVILDLTERKRAEEALRERKARLRLAVESSNTGLWEWDLRSNQVYYSPIWKRQIGYEDHEISDRLEEWRSRVHPEDLEHAESMIQRYLADPWPNYEIEFRFRHKDGSYRWILAKASLLHDEHGKPERMLGSHLDITERKLAEEALREHERLLELFVEHSPAAIAMFDRQMRYLVVSRRWREDYRLGDQAILGRSHYDIFPEIPGRWIDIHRRCLAGAVESCEEEAFLRADGRTDWIRWEVHPWHRLDGEIGGIIIFSEDITGRKLAEQALRDSDVRFRALIDQAHDAFLVADEEGRLLDVNGRACASLGYSRHEILQMKIADIELDLDGLGGPESMRRVNPGESGIVLGRLRRKDGSCFPVEVSWSCVDLEGTKIFLNLARDVSERERAEQALRSNEARLRTLSQRLLEVQEAERAAIARELHDEIGQALTGIKLGAQWVARRMDDKSAEGARMRDCVALAGQALAQTRSLTLALRPPQLDQLGLTAALRDQTERMAASAGFAARFIADAEEIVVDPALATAIFRIVQESLTNVARHARARNVTIEVRRQDAELVVDVRDDGCGFDLASARREAISGASMGLLGMEERATLAGGRLEISTGPGRGTRLQAHFPLPGSARIGP